MKAFLLVSFGTSVNEAREKTIDRLAEEAGEAFGGCRILLSFTSKVIIKKLKERDGLYIPDVEEALGILSSEGVRELLVQPTHFIGGIENEEMLACIRKAAGNFSSVRVGRPLLETRADRERVAVLAARRMPVLGDREAWVFMGHGSGHPANDIYREMNVLFEEKNIPHAFVATVEGEPSAACAVRWAKNMGYRKVYLAPLMLVAGDHARNDMAGDGAASWKNLFAAAGIETECVMRGLGEYKEVRRMYLDHAREAFPLDGSGA